MGYWTALTVLNIPIDIVLWRTLFGGWKEFVECLGYALQPNILSALWGEWTDDWWRSMELWFFGFLCAIIVIGEHWWLEAHTPWPGWVTALFGLLGSGPPTP